MHKKAKPKNILSEEFSLHPITYVHNYIRYVLCDPGNARVISPATVSDIIKKVIHK